MPSSLRHPIANTTPSGARRRWPQTAWPLLLTLLLGAPAHAQSETVDLDFPVTNGTVSAIAHAGNTIFVGGTFTEVGPPSGGGVPFDSTTGAAIPGFPRVTGFVSTAVSDGAGGWFIGGRFSKVGGQARSNLAHINSALQVTAWNPGVTGAGALFGVRALALSGTTLYVGGEFSSVGGQARSRLAAVHATTGAVQAWNPGANGAVNVIRPEPGNGNVYVGGEFTTVAGQPRAQLAKLDPVTGSAFAWSPDPDGTVHCIELDGSSNNVFVGGFFNNISGGLRRYAAKLSSNTGALTNWAPDPNGAVLCMAASGGDLLLGGFFTTFAGTPRNHLAALNQAGTGALRSWNPNVNGLPQSLVVSGNRVYLAGVFQTVGGQPRRNLAAVDLTTGVPNSWAPTPNAGTQVIALSGNRLYAGGGFTSIGGVARNGLAAINSVTRAVLPWDAALVGAPDTRVASLLVAGDRLYVGGEFGASGATPRNGAAAFAVATGSLLPWNPQIDGSDPSPVLHTLSARDGKVYLGGDFVSVAGTPRTYLAAVDPVSGALDPWNPSLDGPVRSCALDDSATIFVSGDFALAGGAPHRRMAAIDRVSGTVSAWSPAIFDPGDNETVHSIVLDGRTLYVGGLFSQLGGALRDGLGAVDAVTGVATLWDPAVIGLGSGGVRNLTREGSLLYVAGDFTGLGESSRSGLAAIDLTSGLPTEWAPDAVGTEAIHPVGASVYLGGSFGSVGTAPQSYLARLGSSPGVSVVTPATGGDTGPVTVQLAGAGFTPGSVVRLKRAGSADVVGDNVIIAEDGNSLTATLELAGVTRGAWDVEVTRLDGLVGLLADGFSVVPTLAPQLHVDLLGPPVIRANTRTPFDLVVSNEGNLDELAVTLWLAGIPADATVEAGFAVEAPFASAGEPDWKTVPLTLERLAGRFVVLVLPRVPPGSVVRRLYLTVPALGTSFTLRAAVTPAWNHDVPALASCLARQGVTLSLPCATNLLAAVCDTLVHHPGIAAVNGNAIWAKEAWQCEGQTTLPDAIARARQPLEALLQPVLAPVALDTDCQSTVGTRWDDVLTVTVVGAMDPNAKYGPHGTLGATHVVPYSVQFENLGNAPAQRVVVFDALDLTKIDVGSLQLQAVTFGDRTVVPPAGRTSFAQKVFVRSDLSVFLTANFDKFTGVFRCAYQAWDPILDQPLPATSLDGFLPAGGQGSVLFTARPLPGLSDGALIRNRASLTFDANAPLTTDYWSNTYDASPPASTVLPLPATMDSLEFTVRWTAPQVTGDLRDYTVYAATDNGPFEVWQQSVLGTAARFHGLPGRQYFFYSVARDTSGNVEAPPLAPDAQTYASLDVIDHRPAPLAFTVVGANPVRGRLRVSLSLPGAQMARLELLDVTGRRVLDQDLGLLGPGRYEFTLAEPGRVGPGVYWLRMRMPAESRVARVVMMR